MDQQPAHLALRFFNRTVGGAPNPACARRRILPGKGAIRLCTENVRYSLADIMLSPSPDPDRLRI